MGTIAGQVTNAILPLAGTSDSSSPFFFSFFFSLQVFLKD